MLILNDYEAELLSALQERMPRVYIYDGSNELAGLTIDEWRELGYIFTGGISCTAIVCENVVLKWFHDTYHSDAEKDMEFFASVAEEDRQYFPETELRGGITVQEKILQFADVFVSIADAESKMYALARKYHITDVHWKNWGIRPGVVDVPVIFDVGCRA